MFQSSPTETSSTSVSASTSAQLTTPTASVGPAVPPRYTVEEQTTTVRVPLFRPRPDFLRVLHLSGAKGEIYTMGEIIHHVKEYIRERILYDQQDPRIVHCGQDLLGVALGVPSFTIHQAVNLFRQNCTLEPDSCIRIRRQLVTRPVATDNISSRRQTGTYTSATQGAQTETTGVTSTTPTTSYRVGQQREWPADSTRALLDTQPSYLSSGPSSQEMTPSSLCTASQPSSSLLSSSSSSSSTVINFRAAKQSVTVTDSDLEKEHGEQAVTSTDSSSEGDSRGKPVRRSSKDGDTRPNQRQRRMSVSVKYDEPDSAAGTWACEVMLETNAGEEGKAEDDTVVVEYDSDTFSVEYDVESGSESEADNAKPEERTCSESDVSSSTSATAILVVRKESDVEYLADYSDSDNGSDAELSDADKWHCEYCSMKNPPFQRNCGGCWSVRPDWLPSRKKEVGGGANAGGQENYCGGSTTTPVSAECLQQTSQESAECLQQTSQESAECLQQTSQESAQCLQQTSQDSAMGSELSSKMEQTHEKKTSIDSLSDKLSSVSDIEDDMTGGHSPKSDDQKKLRKGKVTPGTCASKEDPCVVCLTRRKTASIIHGKTGHQVCCYKCALRLKKQRKSCPICRRPIQKVIRNFYL